MPNFSILLPASGPKAEGGNPFAPDMFDYRSSNTFNYFHSLNADRRDLIDAIHASLKEGADPATVLGALPNESTDWAAGMENIYGSPLMSALDRYAPGVLYKAMDFSGLPTGAQRRLLEEGVIVSGLFGLLRPDDLIPLYLLGLDADIPGKEALTEYWRPRIKQHFNDTVARRLVWNLLDETHEAMWDSDMSYSAMVRVSFHRMIGGEMTLVEDATPLEGRLVNFIVRETLEEIEPLLNWRHPDGFTYDESLSSYDADTRTHHLAMVRH